MSESLKPRFDDLRDPLGTDVPVTVKIEPLMGPDNKPIAIEGYLASSNGQRQMHEFMNGLAGDHLTKHFEWQLSLAAEESRNPQAKKHFIAAMMQAGIMTGLDRPDLQPIFANNPVIYRLNSHRARAHHEGALDTSKLYNNAMVIMMNVIRAEALKGTHRPDDYSWVLFAEGFEYIKGDVHQLNHPLRANPHTRFRSGQQ